MYNVSIPEISTEELLSRYEQIKPIVLIGGKKYFLRNFTSSELTERSFLWNADQDKSELVDMNLYRTYCEFECIHRYGYYGFFKPSIAEVLAQIPKDKVPLVDAFEIIKAPRSSADLSRNEIVFNNGFHMSIVRLYTNINNENVHFVN